MTEPSSKSWGHPAFADAFPKHPDLDTLVDAFADGNYAKVREDAPKLIAGDADDAVKKAAGQLLERTKPDPTSRLLFLIAAALIVFLTGWWIAHKEPHHNKPQAPKRAKPTAPASSPQ